MTPPAVTPVVVPGWVKIWLAILTILLLVAAYFIWSLTNYATNMSAWDKQMHRWAAHYYWCDSVHHDDAKCAQWSDHIPPPPPPPFY